MTEATSPLRQGSKRRTVRVSAATSTFSKLGRGDEEDFVFPSPRGEGHLTPAIGDVCANGDVLLDSTSTHQLRHSHATHAVQEEWMSSAPGDARTFVERDNWALRGCKSDSSSLCLG